MSFIKIAVIGLGAHGLVAVKNLLEEGFDVVGFEKNDYVGGLWHYAPNAEVSCMETTLVNVSRERACFTDFPFADGTSSYPTAAEVDSYLNSYVDHFELRPKLRLGTRVEGIDWEATKSMWHLTAVTKEDRELLHFDKLVVATGPQQVPIMPKFAEEEKFLGRIIHSICFKQPSDFRCENIVVVGLGNTAVDTAIALSNISKKVYLAHRHGAPLLPRILKNGTSLDHGASYRTFAIRDVLEALSPRFAASFMNRWVRTIQDMHFQLDPAWRINDPVPSLTKQNPTVSDNLYTALQSGRIISTHAPRRYFGPKSIELEDGTILDDIDSVIYCTGYRTDFSFLHQYDPTLLDNRDDKNHDYSAPVLYRNMLSHSHPNSLAFIGIALIYFPAFLVADLTTMGLAQIWKNPELLPSMSEMQRQYAEHRAWRAYINSLPDVPGKGPPPLQLETGGFLRWIQEIVGTKVNEHLSYTSLTAWKFWWVDRELCKLLMDGIYTPHIFRLFDSCGRRKKWDGARDAIFKVNEDVKRRTKTGALIDTKKVDGVMPADVVTNA